MVGPPGPCGCGCALTPQTSVGFDQTEFAAEVLHHPDDPWQRWTKIHAGELLPDGSERFRYRLILAARQNGKSEIPVGLVPYWLFVERVGQALATSTKVNMAKKLWRKSRNLITSSALVELVDRRWYREANGEVELWTPWDSRYGVDASNEEGGRSLSVARLIVDELRHHYDYLAWGALVRTMGAVDGAHAWLLSNAGSDRSVVLNDLRAAAVTELPGGVEVAVDDPDTNLFLAEWSSVADADPTDPQALGQANPNMNRRGQKSRDLLADARLAVEAGGEALTEFKTEVMCIRVKIMNPALDRRAWADCLGVGGLDAVRALVAMVWDVSPDMLSVVLYAAAVLDDGRVQIDAVRAWQGPGCTRQAVRDLPRLIGRAKPAALGWLPDGPGVALAADMKPRRGVWPPPGVPLEEIKAEVPAVCMGFDELVRTRQLVRSGRRDAGEVVSGDPLLDDQVDAAEWRNIGNNRRVFSRTGGRVNALYAAAGAAHLARTLPPDLGKFIIR